MHTVTFTKSSLPNGWLGNMCGIYNKVPLHIEYKGVVWKSSENLFQALRFSDPVVQEKNQERKMATTVKK